MCSGRHPQAVPLEATSASLVPHVSLEGVGPYFCFEPLGLLWGQVSDPCSLGG